MINVMAKRPRMYVDLDDERIRWALRIKMARENLPTISAAILRCVEACCEAELGEVDRQIDRGIKPAAEPAPPKPKPTRKPKLD